MEDEELLAAADEGGRLHLFRFPAADCGAPASSTDAAHSDSSGSGGWNAVPPRTLSVQWAASNQHVLSLSAADHSLMQWRVRRVLPQRPAPPRPGSPARAARGVSSAAASQSPRALRMQSGIARLTGAYAGVPSPFRGCPYDTYC